MSTTLEPTHSKSPETDARPRLALVGNPNVGKSVIFGLLTGRYVTVSNYPGTTVTVTRGRARIEGQDLEIVDTPGVNGLIPMSEDEAVTRDILLAESVSSVLQVGDAKNLRRTLLITLQLAEMGLPITLALNMNDEARSLGVEIDEPTLAKRLGISVLQTVAVRRQGVGALRKALREPSVSPYRVVYPKSIEAAADEIENHLPDMPIAKRSVALMVLAGDLSLKPQLRDSLDTEARSALDEIRLRTAARFPRPLETVIAQARLQAVDRLVREVETRPETRPRGLLHRLGLWSAHPVWGVPVLLAVLWAMYQFVGVLGAGTLVDVLESTLFGQWLSPWAIAGADAVFQFPHTHILEDGVITADYTLDADSLSTGTEVLRFVHDFLVGPYGQITMALSYAIALILPIVTTFFLAFGVLEDSGYLPRLAVMVNRIFRTMGLNGKAVLPMVLGLGCDTMATLTTRILDTKKERVLVTLLLALGVPCSAQLGVILGMIRSLSLGATMVWGGAVLGTLFVVGWAAARLVPGETSDFILELPPIRRPQLGNLVIKTLARIEWYLREAVPLFLLGTLLLFVADRFGVMVIMERVSAPVVQTVLGLPAQATEAFLIGFLRRDYGAAGLYDLSREGHLDNIQLVVSMVVITLFVPCVANFFMMIKERGMKTALAMTAFIVPMAILVGGVLNLVLRGLGVTF